MTRKIVAYRLEPVYEIESGSICTADLRTILDALVERARA